VRSGEPDTDDAVAICIEAWNDLSTCRAIGMAVGAIPVTAIYQWAEMEDLDREATRMLKRVIRQLDNDRAEAAAAKYRLETATGGRGGV